MELTRREDQPLRVVLVDDHPLMRASVRRSLEDGTDINVVGEAGSGADALSLVEKTRADVILLDLMLPDADGLDVLRALRRSGSSVRVVILTCVSDAHTARAAIEAGASGYLTKDHANPDVLVQAVRTAQLGLVSMDQCSSAAALEHEADPEADDYGLTPREHEVWLLVTQGLSNPDIAKTLSISVRTAKFHIGNLLLKTGYHSRSEVIAMAYRRGMVPALPCRGCPGSPAR